MIKIDCLIEDYAGETGVFAEFGLSLHIECRGSKILFDTGQLGAFAANAVQLGIDISAIDACVLSHGHFDHGGGLRKFTDLNTTARIYMRAAALRPKYKREAHGNLYIGLDQELVSTPDFTSRVEIVDRLREILPGFYLYGGFNTDYCGFEPLPPHLLDAGGQTDRFSDEQALIIRDGGLHVFAGCSHPGIIGMLEQIRAAFPGERIESVVAGMHIRHCPAERLRRITGWFLEQQVRNVVPLHCTGFSECTFIKQVLGVNCRLLHCGETLSI